MTFTVKLQPTQIWNTQWGPGWCGKCLLFRVGDYYCATESQLIGEVSLKKDIYTFHRAGEAGNNNKSHFNKQYVIRGDQDLHNKELIVCVGSLL